MPYITVESGALSDNQKEELIKRLTEVSSEIMKVPQEFFVTTIKEVPDKNCKRHKTYRSESSPVNCYTFLISQGGISNEYKVYR